MRLWTVLAAGSVFTALRLVTRLKMLPVGWEGNPRTVPYSMR